MIFTKKNHELIRQNEKNVKKSQKHDVNLRNNTTLYFQVGLIICLLFSYALLEMNFETKSNALVIDDNSRIDEFYADIPIIKVYEEAKPKAEKKKKPKTFQNPVVKPDSDPINETDLKPDEPIESNPELDPRSVIVDDKPESLPPINVMLVEQVPVFPGCEYATTNTERRACMSKKISKIIQKKFNTGLGGKLGLSGQQNIYVNFKINKNGDIEILKTQAPHDKLKNEANRVVNKFPKIKPGEHGGQKVDVLYMLPIRFNIEY